MTQNNEIKETLARLQEQIELIATIKVALATVFNLQPEAEPTPKVVKVSVPKVKAKISRKGNNKTPIIEILTASGSPLSPAEIYSRLKSKGWRTTSSNPRSLLGVTLGSLGKQGLLRKVGSDWELAPAATTPPVVAELSS